MVLLRHVLDKAENQLQKKKKQKNSKEPNRQRWRLKESSLPQACNDGTHKSRKPAKSHGSLAFCEDPKQTHTGTVEPGDKHHQSHRHPEPSFNYTTWFVSANVVTATAAKAVQILLLNQSILVFNARQHG